MMTDEKENNYMEMSAANEQTRKTAMMIKKAKQVDWVDAVVKAATVCNQLFQRRACNLCHVYVDRQIEFEQRQAETIQDGTTNNCDDRALVFEQQEEGDVVTPVERLWMQMDKGVEVELYRQFLFDEASVVNHVSEDDERDDDDEQGQIPYHHQPDFEEPSLSSSSVSVETTATEQLEEIQLQKQDEQSNTRQEDAVVVPV